MECNTLFVASPATSFGVTPAMRGTVASSSYVNDLIRLPGTFNKGVFVVN